MKLDPRAAIRKGLAPRSIAVIDASDNPHKIGGRPLAYLSRFGFQGKVYAINPQRAQVQGFASFASFSALPEVPDLVIIALPGELAVTAVSECAAAGVAMCIIMSSGFSESGEAARLQEENMVACARVAGMRLVGPNSQGLANFSNGAVASFSTMFTEVDPADGPVGIVSQSGAMAVIPYGLLRGHGIGVRHSHATGNDCDVTVCELATVVAEDPDLKLLILYLEGIPDPWHLAEAAAIARARKLPVIALKSGRTPAGQMAAMSHTGSLANEDRVVDAFFEEHGIWRAKSMADLVDTAPLYLQGWKPKGRRLVAISNSGAVCVMTADAATRAGMPMEALSAQTQSELKSILPGFATTTNPVDITAALLSNSGLFGAILPPIARDPAADAFLIGVAVAGAGYDVERFAADAQSFATQTGKPLVVASSQDNVAQRFKNNGLVVYPTEGEAVNALSNFLSHASLLEHTGTRQPVIQPLPLLPDDVHMLDEADSMKLLKQLGVDTVAHAICHDVQQAVAAFKTLGGRPVAVKGCSSQTSHKFEYGLVALNLRSGDDVAKAFEEITRNARKHGLALSGVMVAAMAEGERELMIGAKIDPVFGPVMLVGDGGKYVEAMPDMQVLLPPFNTTQVKTALNKLRIAPLLHGVRGDPPMDMDAFARMAVAVGDCMAASTHGITQLDINPVITGAAGQGCVAVDAVVYRGQISTAQQDKT